MELPRAPSFRLEGRHALVTGAGRGIGVAIATALAQNGAHVHLAARSEGEVGEVAEALRRSGWRASPLVLDVLDSAAVQAAIDALPLLSVLVNNAGTNRPKPFDEVTEDDVDVLLALNTKAAFFVARAVASGLKVAGLPGSIVHMSSQMGHVGGVNRSIYCASKHALEGLSKALALELGPHGIRVNTVCPTFIDTPMTHDWLATPAFRAQVLDKIALGRVGRVEDVMGAVLFLASDAAALVTGSALMVDGGWTAS